jgi:hypothetical protein
MILLVSGIAVSTIIVSFFRFQNYVALKLLMTYLKTNSISTVPVRIPFSFISRFWSRLRVPVRFSVPLFLQTLGFSGTCSYSRTNNTIKSFSLKDTKTCERNMSLIFIIDVEMKTFGRHFFQFFWMNSKFFLGTNYSESHFFYRKHWKGYKNNHIFTQLGELYPSICQQTKTKFALISHYLHLTLFCT